MKISARSVSEWAEYKTRRPFKVKQQERMNKISKYFIGE